LLPLEGGDTPNSLWERLFCGPQCVDVAKCCGEGEQTARNDCTDDELVSVVQYDESGPLSDHGAMDDLPIMNQPMATFATFKMDSAIPWADLNGPRKLVDKQSDLGDGLAAPQLLRMRVTDVAKPVNHRAVSPCINPCSKFGFITVTVPASSYLADSSDVMDVEFARHLLALERQAANALELRRLAHGRYEIQGRRVAVRWGPDNGGCELVAREEEMQGRNPEEGVCEEGELPLGEYLRQVGGIAADIRRPTHRRLLTFVDNGAAGDRFESMKIACEQARLREQAALPPPEPRITVPSSADIRSRLHPSPLAHPAAAALGPLRAF